jgi:Flp pilus assembly protein TadD
MKHTLLPLVSAASLLTLAACSAQGRAAQPVSPASDRAEAVAVTAESLFDPEAARDPVLTYRLRLATEPDNPALHNNLGNLYVLRNWMDEAVVSYKRALKLNPASHVAWNNLGTAYMKQGKLGPAMDAFHKAVDRNPRYALAWYNMAVIHDTQGDYERMLDMYLKAVSLQPNLLSAEVNPQVVNNRHLMAIRVKRYIEEEGNSALPLEAMPE